MQEKKLIKIEKIVFGGKGLGRIDGKVVFAEGVLPGEVIEADLIQKKHFFEAKNIEIVSPSKFRVKPDCKYTDCGGCDFRFCDYGYEIELKKEMLADTLKRIAKIEIEKESVSTIFSERNHYRIKSGFKVKNGKIGFFRKKSHSIVDIDYCLQIPEIANRKLKEVRKTKPERDFFIETHPFEEKAFFYFKGEKNGEIAIDFGRYIMLHKTGNFIQANRLILRDFIKTVVNFAGRGKNLVELYAGSGLFTLPLSFNFEKIYAYESSKSACEMLEKSLNANELKNVEILNKPSEKFSEKKYDAIVVDPPREGLSKTVVEKIKKNPPQRMVYVSCNASTFARDLKALSSVFYLKKIALIDNFPATAHFETVALLEKIN